MVVGWRSFPSQSFSLSFLLQGHFYELMDIRICDATLHHSMVYFIDFQCYAILFDLLVWLLLLDSFTL